MSNHASIIPVNRRGEQRFCEDLEELVRTDSEFPDEGKRFCQAFNDCRYQEVSGSVSVSKKRANLESAYALHFAYYNFCRIHASLRVTPAREAGITDHVWTLQEMLAA
jgi:hypothetical protein